MLPGFGAQALGDEPGSCPLAEGAAGLMGAAVTQVGPVTVRRRGLPRLEPEGLLGWGLPCVRQRGQAALLVPGLPLLCAALLGDSLRACSHSPSPGGTAMLCQETPLQMETKATWRDGRCFPRGGGRGCIVLKRRPSLPLPCPFLILTSPRRVSAGKALLMLQNQSFTLQEVEAQLEIFTSSKIMGCEGFGGLPQACVCSSVTLCSHCSRKAVP